MSQPYINVQQTENGLSALTRSCWEDRGFGLRPQICTGISLLPHDPAAIHEEAISHKAS
jgi:hypothetical protein